jgi:hypothetical protein
MIKTPPKSNGRYKISKDLFVEIVYHNEYPTFISISSVEGKHEICLWTPEETLTLAFKLQSLAAQLRRSIRDRK